MSLVAGQGRKTPGTAARAAGGTAAPVSRIGDRDDDARDAHISLCEALDRLLHKGAVIKGEVVISVANIDLVYLGFHVLLASVETARGLAQQACAVQSPEAASRSEEIHGGC